ncbi:MAG: efflux RND transporter periplasmic adaptor subunit [Methylobacter sp.]
MRIFLARPVAALLLSLAGFTAHALDNSVQISQENIDKLGIQLGKPEPVTQIPLLTAPAKVAVPPSQEYIVSTSQAGFIEKMNAGIGDKVGKGQVVAQINSPDLVTLQRDYLKAVSAMELATAIYQRDKKLLQEGVIADRRWQETSSEYRSAVSEADEHRQLLEIAGMAPADVAQFSKTHKLSRELNIRSPIAGVVMERMAAVGTHIDAMAPLYRIANLDELWLEISIPQERAAGIKIGDKVQVENSDASAKITLMGQSVNPENQTVPARAVVQAHAASLRAGQRLNVRVIQASDKAAFKIPNTAIAQNEGKAFVFVRTQQGFSVVPVEGVGKQDNDSVVNGDLTGNKDIAVKGAAVLKANWLGLGSEG